MPSLGDAAQTRLIMEQAIEATIIKVKAEHPEMNDRKGNLSTLIAAVALLLSLASIVYGAAIQAARIDENRRRVEALEQRNDRINEAIARIDSRTASIEAKLQVLIPDRSTEKH